MRTALDAPLTLRILVYAFALVMGIFSFAYASVDDRFKGMEKRQVQFQSEVLGLYKNPPWITEVRELREELRTLRMEISHL